MDSSQTFRPIDDEWLTRHFDHLAPELGATLQDSLARMRSSCPVAHSDRHNGFWVVTKYEDIYRVAQDWETFSSAQGVAVPPLESSPVLNIPVEVDPPLQRVYKRLISTYFTPEAVSEWEKGTRTFATRLIDGFIDSGRCDFMKSFARPFPGVTFFELSLNAPTQDVERLAYMATRTTIPNHPEAAESFVGLGTWINEFVEQRSAREPIGDIVDGVVNAEIEGRPITRDEVVGILQLLILGGLETTGGALGHIILQFCRHPEIPESLRNTPELIPSAVEELLRLDAPMVCIARVATRDTELGGRQIKKGDRVLMYWASANRDADVFPNPDSFDLERSNKRHLAFGLGPHRCVGSNLARMNLRVALEELLGRLDDITLEEGAEIRYHSTFNRVPLALPITFGRR